MLFQSSLSVRKTGYWEVVRFWSVTVLLHSSSWDPKSYTINWNDCETQKFFNARQSLRFSKDHSINPLHYKRRLGLLSSSYCLPFMNHRFASLFWFPSSFSRNNVDLSAADIITLSIIATSLQSAKSSTQAPEYSEPESKTTTSEEEFYSLEASPTVRRKREYDL